MGRASHWALGLAAAPLFAAFAWQSVLASVGDDSVSYVVMARWMDGTAGPLLTPWLAWHSHFPPLFPALLALTGGAHDYLVAHLVVAAFAVASVPLVARLGALRLGNEWAGFWLAAAFLALPTAWLSAKGVLSEPTYLFLSLAVLLAHERWIVRESGRGWRYLAFGVLLAAAYATRVVAIVLVAAFVVRELVVYARIRRIHRAAWLALAPVAVYMAAWPLLRPDGHVYEQTLQSVMRGWLHAPLVTLRVSSELFAGGWIASFVAEGGVSNALTALLWAVGILAVAGAVRAAMRNRIDGWYMLFTLALLLGWIFGVENTRRLLYPVMPLALLHAAESIIAIAALTRMRKAGWAAAVGCALPIVASAPAMLLFAQKATDTTLLVQGGGYRASDISDYYRIINVAEGRALAAKHANTLAGLEALRGVTPAGARVMWMRPEYVALLGGRTGVPSYYSWDAATLARHVRDESAQYLVVAGISKSDLAVRAGSGAALLDQARPFTHPVFALANPFTRQDEFVLLEVDRAALDGFLGGAR